MPFELKWLLIWDKPRKSIVSVIKEAIENCWLGKCGISAQDKLSLLSKFQTMNGKLKSPRIHSVDKGYLLWISSKILHISENTISNELGGMWKHPKIKQVI